MSQPQPLVIRAGIVTVISLLSAALIHTNNGSISSWLNVNADLIAAVVLAVSPIVSAYLSRRHVTPVASPRDNAGNALVPALTAVPDVPADLYPPMQAGTPTDPPAAPTA
jgi:hypothetical protein